MKDLKKSVIKWNTVGRPSPPTKEEQRGIVEEEVRELANSLKANDIIEEFDAIADIFFTGTYFKHLFPEEPLNKTVDIILQNSIDQYGEGVIGEVIAEVIRSNFTKFVPTNTLEEVDQWCQRQADRLTLELGIKVRYNIVLGGEDLRDDQFAVFLDANNKICKPMTYEEPNIAPILNKYSIKLI